MDELIPITRIESFLDGIVNGSAVPDPITRIEVMLNDIINGNTVSLTPITRIEYFLAIISGANLSIPEPITRIETYLAKIAGEDIETPTPITRIEMYLAQWADSGTGTVVTVSGTSPLSLVNALAARIKSLTQYGKCTQSGGDIVCNNGVLKWEALGKNLFDKNSPYLNAFVNSITNAISQGSTQWSFCVPCKPNTTYVLSGMIGGSSRWGSFTSNAVGSVATAVQSGNGTLTTGANDKWLVGLVFAQSQGGTTYDYRDTLQIEYGTEPSPYEPFVGGVVVDGTPETLTVSGTDHTQTASVENLFAVGDVKDEHDIISGTVIRRTEAVYSDGTITIQALDTPVTETVTAQHLSTAEGTNTVSVTSNVDQVELEVQYTKGDE